MKVTYSLFGDLLRLLKSGARKKKWHKLHPESDTIPMNDFDFAKVTLGNGSYGELNVVDFGGTNRLMIGNFVSIAQKVTFLLNGEHHTDRISTYPFCEKLLGEKEKEAFGKGDIVIGDDVWIGYGATILSGVHVGQGAVIAAGALVNTDVEPYAIVGGVPAKKLKSRFSDELICELIKIDYSKLTLEDISKHRNELVSELDNPTLLDWMPKK